ncbi:MAG: macro domain-containing protein [Candidatus Pacebacteria bacterium]|nr:macro domain-containing protein [Candidatus Paceibacterota bacterium]
MELKIEFGNILNFSGGAIVNTVNSSLAPGYGLDGQVRNKAGIEVENQLSRFTRCEPGNVVITSGGKLKQTFIIHAVGPIWKGGSHKESRVLREVYTNILLTAEKKGIQRLAIPNISTGIFGYPKEEAAEIAVEVISSFQSNTIKEVVVYCFERDNYNIYEQILTPTLCN